MARYIDADKLLEKIELSKKKNMHTESIARIAHDYEHNHFMAMLCNQPTADVKEVVRGEWVKTANAWTHDYDEARKPIYKCSCCGRIEKSQQPYCNCGADMGVE